MSRWNLTPEQRDKVFQMAMDKLLTDDYVRVGLEYVNEIKRQFTDDKETLELEDGLVIERKHLPIVEETMKKMKRKVFELQLKGKIQADV